MLHSKPVVHKPQWRKLEQIGKVVTYVCTFRDCNKRKTRVVEDKRK